MLRLFPTHAPFAMEPEKRLKQGNGKICRNEAVFRFFLRHISLFKSTFFKASSARGLVQQFPKTETTFKTSGGLWVTSAQGVV